MADRLPLPLAQVRAGSTLLLPCRLTAKSASGVTLEPVDESFTATGSLSISASAGFAVTGAWTSDPREQPVKVVAFALTVGEVVQEISTGVVVVVMSINVDGRPDRWSPSLSGKPSYTTDGWQPTGATVTLP